MSKIQNPESRIPWWIVFHRFAEITYVLKLHTSRSNVYTVPPVVRPHLQRCTHNKDEMCCHIADTSIVTFTCTQVTERVLKLNFSVARPCIVFYCLPLTASRAPVEAHAGRLVRARRGVRGVRGCGVRGRAR